MNSNYHQTSESTSQKALSHLTRCRSAKPGAEPALVAIHNGQPTTDTLTISEGIGTTHEAVIKLVRTYTADLEEFGTFRFQIQKSGGRPTEYAVLNEPQTTLLLTYMKNSNVVRTFKKRLVAEFYQTAQALRDRKSAEYIEARRQGKIARRQETDVIAEFVSYAVAQGSKNARRYYQNITTMTYRGLGFVAQAQQPVRDFLNVAQTAALTLAEATVIQALRDGMARRLPYKDVYILVKDRVTTLAAALPPQLRLIAGGGVHG